MEEELSKTDRGKELMGRSKDRIDEKVAQMGEQAMQEQGETAPEVNECVDGPEECRAVTYTQLTLPTIYSV